MALASYVLAGDRLISQERSGTSSYYLTDGQRNVRALSDGSATTTDTYNYDAYGTLRSPSGSTENPYRYTSQRFDDFTDLYSLRARSYDPNTGRFLSRDTWPIDFNNPIELNRYGYTANNPINGFDPTGWYAVESGETYWPSAGTIPAGTNVAGEITVGAAYNPGFLASNSYLSMYAGELAASWYVPLELLFPLGTPEAVVAGAFTAYAAFFLLGTMAIQILAPMLLGLFPQPTTTKPYDYPYTGPTIGGQTDTATGGTDTQGSTGTQTNPTSPQPSNAEPETPTVTEPQPGVQEEPSETPPQTTEEEEDNERWQFHIALGFNYDSRNRNNILHGFFKNLIFKYRPQNVDVRLSGSWSPELATTERFPTAFFQAAYNPKTEVIHFNLESMPKDYLRFAREAGNSGTFINPGLERLDQGFLVTAWELYWISQNRQVCNKTIFYEQGSTSLIPSQAAKVEICSGVFPKFPQLPPIVN